jgi:hypothetical protein
VSAAFVHLCACGRRSLVAWAAGGDVDEWLATCRQAAGGVDVIDADGNGFVCSGCGRFALPARESMYDLELMASVPVTVSLN